MLLIVKIYNTFYVVFNNFTLNNTYYYFCLILCDIDRLILRISQFLFLCIFNKYFKLSIITIYCILYIIFNDRLISRINRIFLYVFIFGIFYVVNYHDLYSLRPYLLVHISFFGCPYLVVHFDKSRKDNKFFPIIPLFTLLENCKSVCCFPPIYFTWIQISGCNFEVTSCHKGKIVTSLC